MRNGDENADDIAGRFTGTYTGADARSCKYGTTCEITDEKGKGLPESGKGEALEIPHSSEKEPVSCLTDWHYPFWGRFFVYPKQLFHKPTALAFIIFATMYNA
ncbi:IS4 orf [Shigella flexneri]|nr:putative iS4 ORF [Shigella flexneri]CEP56134.1 IS4 orf [Shigella flexneri 2a]SRF78391.1 IS4 orf [Shigella flexneri 2a]SRF94023.1 IS4 orf [Shigella flexneri 2a]SRG01065.1 IS4 orf [Shigella flexneri 2a]